MKQRIFDAGSDSPVEAAAKQFDERHPELYALVERFALEAHGAGRERIGIAAVWERIRWHFDVERGHGEPYRLNNSFRAYYARRFQQEHPELRELFETRKLRSRAWTR